MLEHQTFHYKLKLTTDAESMCMVEADDVKDK